tara:strand:- start:587 stop:832 length:246 start_codon:yes stop_codon:yes gene_type:complete
MTSRKKTPLHHTISTYHKNRANAARLSKAPKLSNSEEREKVEQFLKSGRAKKYPRNASYLLARDGDLPSQKLLDQWEYIKS